MTTTLFALALLLTAALVLVIRAWRADRRDLRAMVTEAEDRAEMWLTAHSAAVRAGDAWRVRCADVEADYLALGLELAAQAANFERDYSWLHDEVAAKRRTKRAVTVVKSS